MLEALPVAGVAALFALAPISVFAAWWYDWRLRRQLERAHPDIIRHFDESRGPTGRLLTRFIWRNQHESLGDPCLTVLINRTRIAWISAVFFLVAGWIGLQLLN
jgi:hypothetical protein